MKTKGRQIKTLQQLAAAATARQSCLIRHRTRDGAEYFEQRPWPAAFLINRIGHDLLRIFEGGLFLYRPAKSRVKEGVYPPNKPPKHQRFGFIPTPPATNQPPLLLENKS